MSSYISGVIVGFENTITEQMLGLNDPSKYIGVAPEATTVLYKPGDYFGCVMAFASLFPIALCWVLLTVFLCRRTAQDLWIGAGHVANEILNNMVKVIIKEPRPHPPVINLPEDSYGMPSAHSQYMGYFSAIFICETLRSRSTSTPRKIVRIAIVLVMSAMTMYSRYYLHYHTPKQIFIGYLCGNFTGVYWLLLIKLLRKVGLLSWALNLLPFRLMLVKDSDYSVEREYQDYKQVTMHKLKEN